MFYIVRMYILIHSQYTNWLDRYKNIPKCTQVYIFTHTDRHMHTLNTLMPPTPRFVNMYTCTLVTAAKGKKKKKNQNNNKIRIKNYVE